MNIDYIRKQLYSCKVHLMLVQSDTGHTAATTQSYSVYKIGVDSYSYMYTVHNGYNGDFTTIELSTDSCILQLMVGTQPGKAISLPSPPPPLHTHTQYPIVQLWLTYTLSFSIPSGLFLFCHVLYEHCNIY